MVTVQTSIGFLLTIVTIQLTPLIVDMVGWRYGFTYLAVGPLIGIVAMLRLRRLPEARKLAGGRR
jgi:dipeptide/tripeptide permease